MSKAREEPVTHAFERRPHRTLVALSAPVIVSLIAEPLIGLVDTVFVSRLGSVPLAALGVGTTLISSLLWAFNFLGIGTATAVARADGEGDSARGGAAALLALALGAALGTGLCALGLIFAEALAQFMGTEGAMTVDAVAYLRVRLLGAPAVLMMMAGFGALRGIQDMRSPLWIAVAANLMNGALDWLLIFGAGPIPAQGLVGAAWASTLAQYGAAVAVIWMVGRRLPMPARVPWSDSGALFTVGRDLFLRTGILLAFLTLGMRSATRIGADAGAAHTLIRAAFGFTAFLLDAYAHVAQSLIGYFIGREQLRVARRAATVALQWSIATGLLLSLAMWAATPLALAALPESARAVGASAWWIAALSQPISALSFATDGIHWGSGDYAYLRNAMFIASILGAAALLVLDASAQPSLDQIWWITLAWLGIRALFGVLRVWPGLGAEAPLRLRDGH